jgi:aminopeptidase-like protein
MKNESEKISSQMWKWINDLFPLCRSITGSGVVLTLDYIKKILPDLQIHKIASGSKAFDWVIPNEWTIRNAYLKDAHGNTIVDYKENNLHVVGYSAPVDRWLDWDELQSHLHSLVDQKDAIPYVTSYYKQNWGFCLKHEQRETLKTGKYHAYIDSDLKPGYLRYGELYIKGESREEVFLSTYICHPSMANNELSGPIVTMALALWLLSLSTRKYSYRIVFIPETIGSIAYLSKNLELLKKNVIAGFNVTCVGDDRNYTYLPSRNGNTIADRAALHVLSHIYPQFKRLTWLDRGSDERQYCAPKIDLPVATIMRSAYGHYPEYHTSLDNLSFVTPLGLYGGFNALKSAISCIEMNCFVETSVFGEPQLSSRGMYPSISFKGSATDFQSMLDIISYCDGKTDLIEISDILNLPFERVRSTIEILVKNSLVKIV